MQVGKVVIEGIIAQDFARAKFGGKIALRFQRNSESDDEATFKDCDDLRRVPSV